MNHAQTTGVPGPNGYGPSVKLVMQIKKRIRYGYKSEAVLRNNPFTQVIHAIMYGGNISIAPAIP